MECKRGVGRAAASRVGRSGRRGAAGHHDHGRRAGRSAWWRARRRAGRCATGRCARQQGRRAACAHTHPPSRCFLQQTVFLATAPRAYSFCCTRPLGHVAHAFIRWRLEAAPCQLGLLEYASGYAFDYLSLRKQANSSCVLIT